MQRKLSAKIPRSGSWELAGFSSPPGSPDRRRPSAKDGILKERSGAAAIFVAGGDQHSFGGANLANRVSGVGQRRSLAASRKMLFQVGILNFRLAARDQFVGDANNNEASALGGVEDAGAIAEAAGFVAEFVELSVFKIERENGIDGFRDFLPVGPDVLHRRSAHAAGNSAQTFDPRAIAGDGTGDEFVPLFAGSDFERLLCLAPRFRRWQFSEPDPASPHRRSPDCCRHPARTAEDCFDPAKFTASDTSARVLASAK